MLVSAMLLVSAPLARAQDEAVVVIVESANQGVRAEAVRGALRRAGVRALSLTDEHAGAVSDVLTVAVRADGRSATVQFRTSRRLEVRFLRTRRADPRGRWLTAPLAGLVRATRAAGGTNPEVLDPWSTEPRVVQITEVVDPWQGQPPAQMIATALSRVPATDVLDPWRGQPPRRTRPVPARHPHEEIVDPWAAERGERLDRPRPRR